MKRLNPDTHKPFKQGDVREDGYIFESYELSKIKRNGFFREKWLSKTNLKNKKSLRPTINKKYYAKNKEKINDYSKKYYEKNKETLIQYGINYYTENKDKLLEKSNKRYQKDRNDKNKRAARLLKSAKARSKQKNLELAITKDWINEKLQLGLCELTSIEFDFNTWDGKNTNPFSPSLDRIDNLKGYTPDNVRVVLFCVNSALNSYGLKFMVPIFKKLIKSYNAKQKSTAPVPNTDYFSSEIDSEFGTSATAGTREDSYDLDHYCRTVRGEDADYRTKTRG